MNAPQHVTDAIVLTRTDYGEADRILTLLTPKLGKVRLMAKGVRRIRSKLAGGIELFSVTNITFIKGRSEIGTLVSARLQTHYGHIVENLDRTMLGYDMIKLLNKVTEDEPEPEYFDILQHIFAALDEPTIPLSLIRLWCNAQLLRFGGHTPNLQTESGGLKLHEGLTYEFNFEDSSFIQRPDAQYDTNSIKFLRLVFSGNSLHVLAKVQGSAELSQKCTSLVTMLMQLHLRIGG
jgi:DNA repair protein RecO (recombination protein O)